MSDKKIETIETTEPIHHEIGDLTLKCGQCGNVEVLQEDIPGGISFILATIEKAEVKMKCGECDNEIILTFTGMSDDRDVEFKLKREEMEEALKQEQEAVATEAAELNAKENDTLDAKAEVTDKAEVVEEDEALEVTDEATEEALEEEEVAEDVAPNAEMITI